MSEADGELERLLARARRAIDEIDRQLVRLLNERSLHVRRIGAAKRRHGLPIYQPDREEEIFANVVAANAGPLEDAALRRVFERILDESRRMERTVST